MLQILYMPKEISKKFQALFSNASLPTNLHSKGIQLYETFITLSLGKV